MNRRVFKRIFQIAELANLSEDELMAYNASIQAEWDWQNAVELAEERAAAKADENARKEERAKAEAEKRELLKEAEAEKRELLIQSARAFKKSGVPNAVIAESLGLPLDVVEKL